MTWNENDEWEGPCFVVASVDGNVVEEIADYIGSDRDTPNFFATKGEADARLREMVAEDSPWDDDEPHPPYAVVELPRNGAVHLAEILTRANEVAP